MPFTYGVQTNLFGATGTDVATIDIETALKRVADTTGNTNSDIDISGVRGFSYTERALLSIIRNLTVSAAPSAGALYTYIINGATSESAPSGATVSDTSGWVNCSDLFTTNVTPTNSVPYLVDAVDPTTSFVDFKMFRVTLTHAKQNEEFDFELRLVYMTDDGLTTTDVSNGGIPWVRTGPVFSNVDGKLATTVDLSGYLPGGVAGVSAAERYVALQIRFADSSAIPGSFVHPILQTKSSTIAYESSTTLV